MRTLLFRSPPPQATRAQRESGVALIIVLAFVVLLSGLIIAYFSRATLSRQVSNSSAAQTKADVLAQSALQTVLGDLKQEMAAGSNADGTPTQAMYTDPNSGIRVFVPTTTVGQPAVTAVPARSGVPAYMTPSQGALYNDPLANLLKRSDHNSSFFPGSTPYNVAAYPTVTRASDAPSDTASANGRYVSTARWNKGLLLSLKTPLASGSFPALPNDYTPDSSFKAPDWVVVTRGNAPGLNSAGNPITAKDLLTLADASGSNTNFAVGRFAYTVYDEGGMLDLNVAGNQLSQTTDPANTYGGTVNIRRGQLHQVNLDDLVDPTTNAKLVANSQALLMWRASGTGAIPPPAPSSSPVIGSLFDPLRDFISVQPKDQTFLSRQDLLNYAKANPSVVDGNAMKYLGTFSRSLNLPSWFPVSNATGAAYQYRDNAGTTTLSGGTPNPNLIVPNIRWKTSHTFSDDGTTVPAGTPFLRRRFPLSRLGLLTHTATAAASDLPVNGNIYRYFGLSRSSATAPWTYNHGGVTGKIMTLQQVADSGRDEPDFFEMLQAGILSGSLGRDGGAPGLSVGPMNRVQVRDNDKALHVLAIGANIIDQYSSTNIPTHIRFNSAATGDAQDVFGTKNLPYFYMILAQAYRPAQKVGTLTNPYVYGYFQPGIWNPHQKLAAGSALVTPTSFRVRVSGAAYTAVYINNGHAVDHTNTTWNELNDPTSDAASPDSCIYFDVTNPKLNLAYPGDGQYEPAVLQTATQATATGMNVETTAKWTNGSTQGPGFIGFNTGQVSAPDSREGTNKGQPGADQYLNAVPWPTTGGPNPGGMRFYLEYKDPTNSTWNTYARIDALQYIHSNQEDAGHAKYFEVYGGDTNSITVVDPRTSRMGAVDVTTASVAGSQSLDPAAGVNNGLRQPNRVATAGYYFYSANVVNYSSSPYAVGNLGDNTKLPANYAYYNDLDGVCRSAAGARATSASAPAGHPMQIGNQPSRPVILSRPFRSVAEMGYAFRDEPWKNLDFGSAVSADGALLDLFTIDDNPEVAGRVNLNTRNLPVLQAMISGTLATETKPSNTITAATAQLFASSIIQLTQGSGSSAASSSGTSVGPLLNRAELATRIAPLLKKGDDSDVIKEQEETAVRALAEAGQTRTWNLLIDVIAQTGRYRQNPNSSSAKPLADQFVVEGEKRYWLHVALDRYTGKVIDQSLEPVYE